MATLKQIAEKTGVTKQTVTAKLKELGLWETHVNQGGRTFEVDDFAASAVADALKKAPEKSPDAEISPETDSGAVDAYKIAIESLKSALSAAESQNAALLAQNQQQAATIEALTTRLADLSRPRSLVERLFGRRALPAPEAND